MPRKGGLLDEYLRSLTGRADSTVETYRRELGQLLHWISQRPGNSRRFRADQLTATALETYLVLLGGRTPQHQSPGASEIGGLLKYYHREAA